MAKRVQAMIAGIITLFFSFNPLVQLIFGLGAAGISGYIEYEILSSLIPEMPYILHLVVIIETMKLILIFNYGRGDQSKSKIVSFLIRVGFILLSVYCSMLFCLHKLHAPESETYVKEETQKLDHREETEIAQISNEYSKITREQTAVMNQRLDDLYDKREKEKEFTFKGTNDYKGKRYHGYTEEINALQKDIDRVKAKIRQEMKAEIELVKIKFDSRRAEIKGSSKDKDQVGAPILLASLSVMYGEGNFDDSMYNINIILISLLLVLILEGLIYYTFVNLAEDYGEILQWNLNGYKNKKEGASINEDIHGMYGASNANDQGYLNAKFKDIYARLKSYNDKTINRVKDFFNIKN